MKTLKTLITFLLSFTGMLLIEGLKIVVTDQKTFRKLFEVAAIMEDLAMDSLEDLRYYDLLEKLGK